LSAKLVVYVKFTNLDIYPKTFFIKLNKDEISFKIITKKVVFTKTMNFSLLFLLSISLSLLLSF